uniref:Uncharacterized protein n=1 Tax=Octopus bimaculoides TaxID=37653 RepID=A0A0L8I2J3_OCTBM
MGIRKKGNQQHLTNRIACVKKREREKRRPGIGWILSKKSTCLSSLPLSNLFEPSGPWIEFNSYKNI